MAAICKSTGTPILFRIIHTPLGKYVVKVCGEGAHSVHRDEGNGTGEVREISVLEANPMTVTGDGSGGKGKDPNVTMRKLIEWFHLYFSDLSAQEKVFPEHFKFCTPDATELQLTIWKALQENVRFGATISYGELANVVGRPKAARAVGTAMRTNPNCMIVPCHRVVKVNSELGNYGAGGVEVKRWLLEHEKAMAGGKTKGVGENNGVAA